MLLAETLVNLPAQQGFAVGKGVNQQPLNMGRLQSFARALLVIGNHLGKHRVGAVVHNLDGFAA